MKLKANRGFTVVETLVTLFIIVLVSTLILWPFSSFRNTKLLDGAAEDVLSTLHEAQTRTLSSDGGNQYGVYFESDKITLLPEDRELALHNSLQISNISLNGGGATVTFDRLTGTTANYGTITISLINDNTRERVISIGSAGSASLN